MTDSSRSYIHEHFHALCYHNNYYKHFTNDKNKVLGKERV